MAEKSGETILSASNVSREYIDGERKLRVLQGIDLEIREGEFVGIVGQSGSGKSTLLHLLGALDRPSTGKVLLRGHDLSTLSDRRLADLRSREVGFVFQFHHLLHEFTALENVLMPGMIARRPQPEVVARAQELLHRVGLSERLHHRPSKLSGGEQQRVAVARALFSNPSIVFADEPTGNLDAQTGREVLELMIEITAKAGKALVMVTHDMDLARRADRLMTLRGGVLETAA